MSPISSRNRVPVWACSKRPMRLSLAPVKAPFSCPNNSDSSNSLGMAAVLRAINGLFALGLCLCRARATSSLPVPDSPVISTVRLDRDNLPMARKTSCMAWAEPMISVSLTSSTVSSTPFLLRPSLIALLTRPMTSSTSNGFDRYSKAPPLKADTARSRSE